MLACETPGEHLPNWLSTEERCSQRRRLSPVLPRELRRQACQLSKTSGLAATKPAASTIAGANSNEIPRPFYLYPDGSDRHALQVRVED